MGQVIELRLAQDIRPAPPPGARCRCTNCGADLWHIRSDGEVCCADCETACPYRLQASNDN